MNATHKLVDELRQSLVAHVWGTSMLGCPPPTSLVLDLCVHIYIYIYVYVYIHTYIYIHISLHM